jgi:hypothetical protein
MKKLPSMTGTSQTTRLMMLMRTYSTIPTTMIRDSKTKKQITRGIKLIWRKRREIK